MYICVCKAVTDSRIRALAQEGARHLRDLRRETGLGSGCGKCARAAYEVLCEAQVQPIPMGCESHAEALNNAVKTAA